MDDPQNKLQDQIGVAQQNLPINFKNDNGKIWTP